RLDVLLPQAEILERLTARDPDLRLDEVDERDLLGDGVLDLDARIGLDEVVLAVGAEQELERARVAVADGARELDRVLGDALANRRFQAHGGRDLDDLLMPPLHGAVALE